MSRGARWPTLLLLVVAASRAEAQERVVELPQRLECVVQDTPAGTRRGGYGYVTAEFVSRDRRAHRARVELRSGPSSEAEFSVTATVELAAGERRTLHLPLPSTRGLATLHFFVDGAQATGSLTVSMRLSEGGYSELHIGKGRRGRTTDSLLVRFGRITRRNPGSFVERRPQDLPDRWQLISGFDLVVVDGGARGLGAGRQEVLKRYVAAGGYLLVWNSGALADGPLTELMGEEASGHLGLGSWLSLPAVTTFDPTDWSREPRLSRTLKNWLDGGGHGPAGASSRSYSGPPHDEFYGALVIPGLGEVPVRLFFVLILVFAVLVGPINYFLLRRRRRLSLLVVTVPAAGFTVTAVILLYGMFSEGFGIKGAARTLTLLDQRAHEAVALRSQTIYAGLSPSELTPAPGTFLFSADLPRREWSRDATHALAIDLDRGGRVDGSLLPSRTPTSLYSVTLGRARERLRFRRTERGALELLYAPEFAPVDRDHAVVLRDFDGRYYVSRRDGSMERVASADNRLAGLVDAFVRMPRTDPAQPGYLALAARQRPRRRVLESWCAHELLDRLVPGSYLARMRDAPAADDLGLDVDYLESCNLVLGTLAEEDIVE